MKLDQYKININKIICRLLPFYLRGRNLILFLQGIAAPLDFYNKGEHCFQKWAQETLLSASMTAQPIRIEWYLNYLFKDKWKLEDNIKITTYSFTQNVVYRRKECMERQDVNGKIMPISPNQNPIILYDKNLITNKQKTSLSPKNITGDISYHILITIPKINIDAPIDNCVRELQIVMNKYLPVSASYLIRTNN